jgi:hypothetical protein
MQTQDCLEDLIGAIVADRVPACALAEHIFVSRIRRFPQDREEPAGRGLTAAILGHACEDGRHALGLKKLTIKLGGAQFDSYAPEALLCGEEAEAYFQDLDQACDEAFADRSNEERARLVYGYETWLVERRALDVYQVYKRALGESEIARKLGGVLAEETKHLADVEALLYTGDPEFSTRSKEFEAVEAVLYQNFIDALAHELAGDAAIAPPVSA